MEKDGTLKISEDVIATISRLAVNDIKGVEEIVPVHEQVNSKPDKASITKKIASIRLADIKKIIPDKKRHIKVKLLGDVVEITISIVIKYGYNVITVAESIQQAVKSSVQSMTGITVSRVNVIVSGISLNKDKQN